MVNHLPGTVSEEFLCSCLDKQLNVSSMSPCVHPTVKKQVLFTIGKQMSGVLSNSN